MHESAITGYKKPVSQLTLCDRQEIIETLKCHSIKVTIPEMNQFAEGLQSLGVLTYMKKYPHLRQLFVKEGSHLTAR